MRTELVILKNLVHNEVFVRKVLPFLKSEYFSDSIERGLFNEISSFISTYNATPHLDALKIAITEKRNIGDQEIEKYNEYFKSMETNEDINTEVKWLVDVTEKFCQEKALYNAVLNSISIIDGKDKVNDKGTIPKLLYEALSVSFDNAVGHDYLLDALQRYEYYHRIEEKIPFDLEYFNRITKGGVSKKTLNIILAGTGVGKSLFMCHFAAAALTQGKNVLYITLEMAEERIAERIDANLLNITTDDLRSLPSDNFENRVQRIRDKTVGKLIIKEYPTASASTIHFRSLLNELDLKKNFKPDIIFVDYLNICTSARIKASANINSYTYVKAIAEELRGLAVEFNVPIWSATQTTRSGFTSSDPGLEDTSESFGLPATADLMIALISSEELEEMGQVMVKQLKNRYADPTKYKRFAVGVDRSKMRVYDVEQSGQENISDSGQPAQQIPSFKRPTPPTQNKNKFDGYKV